MSNTAKNKGSRVERELAQKLTDAGIPTRRVIGSGAHERIDSRLEGDLQIGTHGVHGAEWLLTGEVKARKNGEGFVTLEKWLGKNDLLLLKRNNRSPICVMPWSTLVPLLETYYRDCLDGNHIDGSCHVLGLERVHGGEK